MLRVKEAESFPGRTRCTREMENGANERVDANEGNEAAS